MADENPKVQDVLAGEYVLGTLDAAERAAAETLLARDAGFAARVRQWEARLGSLAESLPAVRPPEHVRGSVLRRIAGDSAETSKVIDLRPQLRLWRGLAAAAAAVAAVLAGLLVLQPPPAPPGRYVAVLQPEGQGTAFVATIDLASGFVSMRRTGSEPEAGKSHELWAVGGGRDKPESLGVIDVSLRVPAKLTPETILAVSLEPAGGSPTGQPTGPVLYTGQLVRVE